MKYVYIVRAGTNHYKVGVTASISKRIKALQTSNPVAIEFVTARLVLDPFKVEKELHQYLAKQHIVGAGSEWVALSAEQAIELIVKLGKYKQPEFRDKRELNEIFMKQSQYIAGRLDAAERRLHRKADRIEAKETRQRVGDSELAESAYQVFKDVGYASVSLMQARLRIGYGRAFRVMQLLEEQRKVGVAAEGSHKRTVN